MRENVNVVLVHGAWADGSSWAKVIGPLAAEGVRVLAAPLPLTSFAEDTAAVERTLERAPGPVVLVGHAYAGAVIAATRNEKVKALVYVAALAPDEGETVANVFYRGEPHPKAPKLAPDDHGLIYLPEAAFAAAFAQNASAAELAGLHHRPGGAAAVEGPAGLVSRGRAGPHDRTRKSALHGRSHEGSDPFASRGSRAVGDRAVTRPGHRPRGDRAGCRGLTTTVSSGRLTDPAKPLSQPRRSVLPGQQANLLDDNYEVIIRKGKPQ